MRSRQLDCQLGLRSRQSRRMYRQLSQVVRLFHSHDQTRVGTASSFLLGPCHTRSFAGVQCDRGDLEQAYFQFPTPSTRLLLEPNEEGPKPCLTAAGHGSFSSSGIDTSTSRPHKVYIREPYPTSYDAAPDLESSLHPRPHDLLSTRSSLARGVRRAPRLRPPAVPRRLRDPLGRGGRR